MNNKHIILLFLALAVISLAAGYFIPTPARVTVIDKTVQQTRPAAIPENILKADWFSTGNYWESNTAYGALLVSNKKSPAESIQAYKSLLENLGWTIKNYSSDPRYRMIEAQNNSERLIAEFLETVPNQVQITVKILK